MKLAAAGAAAIPAIRCGSSAIQDPPPPGGARTPIFSVRGVSTQALTSGNHHQGVDALIALMAANGLGFYRSVLPGPENSADGLIAASDVVLLKVNAQWKYRGCTNSDLVRGLVQRILEHPEGFTGEVVIIENGQGRGSLACDTSSAYNGDDSVQANAEDPSHSFVWLVDELFRDPRVSAFLLDSLREIFIGDSDHTRAGYRLLDSVSYPCFTTAGGRRVEVARGIWNGASFDHGLKLINIPVLKHHDDAGAMFTGALKLTYGLLSMSDGQSGHRHYSGLGETTGKMMTIVQTPVLNVMDAIWVSHAALEGYPASQTFRANRIAASQDPVALDYWSAKNILYPIDNNPRHDPDDIRIDGWLTRARDQINDNGGFSGADRGIAVTKVTKTPSEMRVFETDLS